jgi:hypothetical protein
MNGLRVCVGSNDHKELFCRSFIATHDPYDPRMLPWPKLDDDALARLRSIPFWGTALQIERNAGFLVNAFAQTINDPLIREAVALQGFEEDRHALMIGTLVDLYGLRADEPGELPSPTKRAFIDFGYNECLDSFFGFGVFRLAAQARALPDELISLFTRVIHEEARHIVFFVNWIAYDRVQSGYRSPLSQVPGVTVGYIRSLARLIKLAAGGRKNQEAQTYGNAFNELSFSHLTLRDFVQACLDGNDEEMAKLDPRLLKPRVVPAIARFAINFMPRNGKPAIQTKTAPEGAAADKEPVGS